MGTVRYTTVNGEVLAEKRGGVRRSYVPDPLGSTIALLDNTQTQTDSFTYWPYGEVKTRTGTTATPFQFVGTLGYYHDSTGRDYVRARHLRKDLARWQTEDPLRDGTNYYSTVYSNPTSMTDDLGLAPAGIKPGDCPGKDAYDWVLKWIWARPACAAVVGKVCPNGLVREIGNVNFILGGDCTWPGAGSVCIRQPGPGPCVPKYVCYTPSGCRLPKEQRGCLLLNEMMNWCSCKYRNAWNEKAAGAVLEICGLTGYCHPGTKYK